jgi:hypothetical protein
MHWALHKNLGSKPAKQVEASSLGRKPQDQNQIELRAHEMGASSFGRNSLTFLPIVLSPAFAGWKISL